LRSSTRTRARAYLLITSRFPLRTLIQISLAAALTTTCNAGRAVDAIVAETFSRNPEIKAYESEIAAARGARRAAGEWRNPEITTDVGAKLVRDVPGGPDSNGVLWTVSALQTFEYPGRVRLRKAIANRQIALAELELEGFKAALAARVRAVIFRAALSEAKVSGTAEVSTRFDELSSVLSQRPVAGVAPQLDLRIIESNAVALKRRTLEAEREIQSARYTLNQLRGVQPDAALDIPQIDLTLAPVPETATLLTTARRQNYDIRTHVMELEQQGFKVQLALNERWPAVQLGPFAHQERADTNEYHFGIGMTVPLPLWNRNAGNIETERARAAKAEAELAAIAREVERKVAEAAFLYRSRREEAEKLQSSILPQMREAAELADRNYRTGALPIATYTEVQKQYLDSLDAFFAAQSAAIEARQRLEELTATRLDKR
jgi:outer membrane protein, heavy metal efflux system